MVGSTFNILVSNKTVTNFREENRIELDETSGRIGEERERERERENCFNGRTIKKLGRKGGVGNEKAKVFTRDDEEGRNFLARGILHISWISRFPV